MEEIKKLDKWLPITQIGQWGRVVFDPSFINMSDHEVIAAACKMGDHIRISGLTNYFGEGEIVSVKTPYIVRWDSENACLVSVRGKRYELGEERDPDFVELCKVYQSGDTRIVENWDLTKEKDKCYFTGIDFKDDSIAISGQVIAQAGNRLTLAQSDGSTEEVFVLWRNISAEAENRLFAQRNLAGILYEMEGCYVRCFGLNKCRPVIPLIPK